MPRPILVVALLVLAAPARGAVPSERYLYDIVAAAHVLVDRCHEPKALLGRLVDWAAGYGLVISDSRAEKIIDDEQERHARWADPGVHCQIEHNFVVDALRHAAPPTVHQSEAAAPPPSTMR